MRQPCPHPPGRPRPFAPLGLAAGRPGQATIFLAFALPWLLAWAPLLGPLPSSLRGADGTLALGVQDAVLQRRPEACALAVLAMLAAAEGRALDQELLATRAAGRLGRGGMRLADVAALARESGLAGAWLEASVSDLASLPLPFAAELRAGPPGAPGHLVLVRRVDGRGVLLADPERGLIGLDRASFAGAWAGAAFVPGGS